LKYLTLSIDFDKVLIDQIIFLFRNGKRNFMKRIIAFLPILTAILYLVLSPRILLSQEELWKKVDEGLYIGEFVPRERSKINDSTITIVKIDPRFYSFKLLCASEHGKINMSAKKWCREHNLISAINAGMYQEDGIRNVGYMKNFNHINNPKLNATYKAVLAFNPIELTLPEIQIIDLKCQDFEGLRLKYQTLVQNIRMIGCQQENVWRKKDRTWSMAVLGIDKSGNALFIFTESYYSGYDFANILLSLPISIYNAMYLEGGQEANLYFSANDIQFERIGRHTIANENDYMLVARPVPNVIGIVKKSK
jgi:uncharacterized protein YigE (DUF2233 family)